MASRTALSPETISRLRLGVMRLGRRIRQNSSGGHVTPSQIAVLSTVDRHGPMTLGELAALENVQPPSITRTVTVLEEKGLLRRRGTEDRRVSVVETTAAGRKEMAALRARQDSWLARCIAELEPDEVAALERALPVIERLVGEQP